MILKLLAISVVLIGIALMGIAVKMFFIKGGRFTKSCSSLPGEKSECTCGGVEETSCVNYEKHHGPVQ